MLWRKSATAAKHEQEWIAETWDWLDDLLGPVHGARRLVLPQRATFPDTPAKGHARAEHYFRLVCAICGVPSEKFELLAQAPRPYLPPSLAHGSLTSKMPLGTYQQQENAAVITYDPAIVDDPLDLIATLVHEIAHDLLGGAAEPPPGGEELSELATDLACAHLGFGLFGANTAFAFTQVLDFDRQGWQARSHGYLSEALWCYATALFCELTGTNAEVYKIHCKGSVQSAITKNRAYFTANPQIIRGIGKN